MYRLLSAPYLKELITQNIDILAPSSLFENETLYVIQSSQLLTFLQHEIARQKGVSFDLNSMLPEKALFDLIKGYKGLGNLLGLKYPIGSSRTRFLYIDTIRAALFTILKKQSSDQSSYFARLLSSREFSEQIKNDKTYEVADAIAGLFYRYMMNGAQLLQEWESRDNIPTSPIEKWERELWRALRQERRSLVPLSTCLLTLEKSGLTYQGKYKRVVVIGSVFLGKEPLEFLCRLGREIEVIHLFVCPTKTLFSTTSPLPFLENVSSLGRRFIEILDLPESSLTEPQMPSPKKKSNLTQLASLLFSGKMQEKKLTWIEETPSTLTTRRCLSPFQELEAAREDITALLEARPDLQLSDIAIMAPNINDYAPMIKALFSSEIKGESFLPYNIIDLEDSQKNQLFQVITRLFELPSLGYSFPKIEELLQIPLMQKVYGFSEQDLKTISALVSSYDLLSLEKEKETQNALFPSSSWEAVCGRLALATLSDDVLSSPYPEDVTERELPQVEKFLDFFLPLKKELSSLTLQELTFSQWVEKAQELISPLIESASEGESSAVLRAFGYILTIESDLEAQDETFPFAYFQRALVRYVQKLSGQKGRFLISGITFSSLKPMRTIAFKAIFVLGLSESHFPKQDTESPYDVIAALPREDALELTTERSDSYSFLETLTLGADYLCLSAPRSSGEGSSKNGELALSPLCLSLAQLIEEAFDLRGQPLFAPYKITGKGETYSKILYQKRALLSGDSDLTFPAPIIEPKTYTLIQLTRLIKNPLLFLAEQNPAFSQIEFAVKEAHYGAPLTPQTAIPEPSFQTKRDYLPKDEETFKNLAPSIEALIREGQIAEGSFFQEERKQAARSRRLFLEAFNGMKLLGAMRKEVSLSSLTSSLYTTEKAIFLPPIEGSEGSLTEASFPFFEKESQTVIFSSEIYQSSLSQESYARARIKAALLCQGHPGPLTLAFVQAKGGAKVLSYLPDPDEEKKMLLALLEVAWHTACISPWPAFLLLLEGKNASWLNEASPDKLREKGEAWLAEQRKSSFKGLWDKALANWKGLRHFRYELVPRHQENSGLVLVPWEALSIVRRGLTHASMQDVMPLPEQCSSSR